MLLWWWVVVMLAFAVVVVVAMVVGVIVKWRGLGVAVAWGVQVEWWCAVEAMDVTAVLM